MLLSKNCIILLGVAVLSVCCVEAVDEKVTTTTPLPTPSTHSSLNPAYSTYDSDVDKKKTTTTTSSVPTVTTSTILPTPSTSTSVPTTSSTPKPLTTTTLKPTTTSTTPKPTTVAPVTTTESPKPMPDPTTGKWDYTEANQTCVIAQLAMQLNITYTTVDNTTAYKPYNVPTNLTRVSSGDCGNGTVNQQITIEWGPKNRSSTFLLLFSLNTSTHEYSVKELVFSIDSVELPANAKNETVILYHTGNVFATPTETSYHCTKVQTLNLTKTEGGNDVAGTVRVSHVQLEAYHKAKSGQFSYAKDCDAIDTPDIVPIAVGFALVALIVIVLIAYLVGRRRAQARGYVSM